jgi:hypothetical protein
MGARACATVGLCAGVGCIVTCVLMLMCGSALAGVSLPDGRAWEMVSPLDKNGGEINGIDGVVPNNGLPEGGVVQASQDGNSITYVSLLAFPASSGKEPDGAPVGSQYLSTLEVGGWLTENLTTPMNSKTYPAVGSGAPYKAFSSDLSVGLMLNGAPPVENPQPPLAAGALSPPPRYENYYLRNNGSREFEAILTSPPQEDPSEFFLELLGVTPDLSHIVIRTPAALTAESLRNGRGNLYEWAGGQFQPVSILPGEAETASGEALLGMGSDESRTISNDGSRIFWSRPESRALFERENIGTSQAKTVQIDISHGPDPSGLGEFKTASADGSRVFFTDRRRLTSDATADGEAAHQDLYMFDLETGQPTDLTVDGADPEGASVLGVLEASEDGSYVYFVAEGGLPGTGAVVGHDNLYVWHEGTTKFIGALSGEDSGHEGNNEPVVGDDWSASVAKRTVRLTSDGQHLAFMSDAQLTGYDNRDVNTGLPDEEVYLYDAVSGRLTCVSCNPSGARPIGPSGIPGGTPWRTVFEAGAYQSRALSEEGDRVFFDSRDAVAPQDTNGAQDVYEWEQDGIGTCRREAGCVFLLSGATSGGDSSLVDASANGNDVFFVTRTQLVSQDTDQLRDLYDARAPHLAGEVVAFPALTPALMCEGESCLPPPSPALALGSFTSTTFNGAGNLLPAPKPAAKAKAKKRAKPKKGRKKGAHRASAGRPRGPRRRRS